MRRYLLLPGLMSLFLISACGRSGTAEMSSESDDYIEDTGEREDKSQRPSPPRSSTAEISGVNVTIDYSSPAVKGREIFGSLEPYGKIWRTGANEATVITLDGEVLVNGEVLPAGQYSLFTIPGETEWTIIFNKEANQWGSFNYNEAHDQLRLKINPEVGDDITERLTFNVAGEGRIDFAWEKVSFSLAVTVP